MIILLSPILLWVFMSFSPAQFGGNPRDTTILTNAFSDYMFCPALPAEARRNLINLSKIRVEWVDFEQYVMLKARPSGEITCGFTMELGQGYILMNANEKAQKSCWPSGDPSRTLRHEYLHAIGLGHSPLFYEILYGCNKGPPLWGVP